MVGAMLVCVLMVVLTVGTHYEGLALLTRIVERFSLRGRPAMIFVILWLFALHTLEVWMYALAYMLAPSGAQISFGGQFANQWSDYFYFSATSYTSLGLGDVFPHGGMRLITGVEALNGLMMIAWSASYSYLMMERLWGLPAKGGRRRSASRRDAG